jgi:EAL domain-containing protein (putative c-di-GMP-specific phosphodiesterase class I)
VHTLSRPGARAIVSFLITLAHSLNMQVVVEGVETTQQLEIIRNLNGNDVQGFLMGRPTASPQLLLRTREGSMTESDQWMVETV